MISILWNVEWTPFKKCIFTLTWDIIHENINDNDRFMKIWANYKHVYKYITRVFAHGVVQASVQLGEGHGPSKKSDCTMMSTFHIKVPFCDVYRPKGHLNLKQPITKRNIYQRCSFSPIFTKILILALCLYISWSPYKQQIIYAASGGKSHSFASFAAAKKGVHSCTSCYCSKMTSWKKNCECRHTT